MEPAAQVVVYPACRHAPQGVEDDRQRLAVPCPTMVPKQERDQHRLRKLRRAAEPAVHRIEARRERLGGLAHQLRVQGSRRRLAVWFPLRPVGRRALQCLPDLLGGHLNVFAVVLPRVPNRRKYVAERRHPMAALGRKVWSPVKRDPERREEDRERPSPGPGHRLHRAHVD